MDENAASYGLSLLPAERDDYFSVQSLWVCLALAVLLRPLLLWLLPMLLGAVSLRKLQGRRAYVPTV